MAKYWQAADPAAAEAVVPPQQSMLARLLSLDERIGIADQCHQPGMSLRTIAARLGRSRGYWPVVDR
ncbi:helix-turn-helix domain-containing protein [Kibdelosporangium aridum]|uniref:Helix-turn-helix domain-containing protein n=1 Tax=Kibdelosporangium aridum TaxID=2030 RepID=A0A428Y9J2_KIBAR|nr:helix-turn-helix domain-containing protein [Kibdelosporangium aridum]RSM64172.1 helix-turn-helix domain-containing protein [Kibdelosporangium aridum]